MYVSKFKHISKVISMYYMYLYYILDYGSKLIHLFDGNSLLILKDNLLFYKLVWKIHILKMKALLKIPIL